MKQPFWEEEQRAVLLKEKLGARLSQKVDTFKVTSIKNYYNVWAKFTSDYSVLDIVKKGLQVNLNNVVVGNAPHLFHHKQEEGLVVNSEVEKLFKKELLSERYKMSKDMSIIIL